MNDLVNQENFGELALRKLLSMEQPEKTMLQMQQVECSVVHHFGPGVCIREVFMPAGTLAIGHKQKFDHLNVMLRGKVMVANDDGTTQILTAPVIFTGKAGRKIGYVMEDMVWQNIYPTNIKDADAVEAFFVEKSDDWHNDQATKFAIDSVSKSFDREDYLKLLADCGIPHEIALQQSENQSDFVWVDSPKTRVSISPIEGKGLFATFPLKAGQIICPARINGNRSQAGRYTNHSAHPNAKMVLLDSGDIDLVALIDIEGSKGGSMGTEITIDYRQALALSGIEFKETLCQQ